VRPQEVLYYPSLRPIINPLTLQGTLVQAFLERNPELRAYLIDEISSSDVEKVRAYLEEHAQASAVQGLFWLEVPEALLKGVHLEHLGCRPYCVAIELGAHFLRFELLVRSRSNHRCGCSSYAEPEQREFVIRFAEKLIRELSIRT